jgi:hypothetical protein
VGASGQQDFIPMKMSAAVLALIRQPSASMPRQSIARVQIIRFRFGAGLCQPVPVLGVEETRLQDGLELQGVDLFENGLEPLFQLLFCPWVSLRFCKLPVVGDRAPIKIGRFVQQFRFLVNWCRHTSILQDIASADESD